VVRVHVLVSGRVQGVFFRRVASEQARGLGLAGWVRNRSDGRVEAVFEGTQDAVDRMVSWCHEGTPWSKVDRVEVSSEEPEGLNTFRIR
jgi:acylphosphatase